MPTDANAAAACWFSASRCRFTRPRDPDRIASTVGDRTQLIELARVTHFYALDKVTYAATPRPALIDATLNDLEAKVDPPVLFGFIAPHWSMRRSCRKCTQPRQVRSSS